MVDTPVLLQAINTEDNVVHKIGGIVQVGSASPKPNPFKGRLPPDVDARASAATSRSIERSVAEADKAAALADRQDSVIAGIAAASAAVLLKAAVRSGAVDEDKVQAQDLIRMVFNRKLVKAHAKAIRLEEGPCYVKQPADTSPATLGTPSTKLTKRSKHWRAAGPSTGKRSSWNWTVLNSVRGLSPPPGVSSFTHM